MRSHRSPPVVETKSSVTPASEYRYTERMRNFERQRCVRTSRLESTKPRSSQSEADRRHGEAIDTQPSTMAPLKRSGSARHAGSEQRPSTAAAPAQASFALSFCGSANEASPARAVSGPRHDDRSNAKSASKPPSKNVKVTIQGPSDQQLDFVETRTTPDGVFVMKWAYRPAQTESSAQERLPAPPERLSRKDAIERDSRTEEPRSKTPTARPGRPATQSNTSKPRHQSVGPRQRSPRRTASRDRASDEPAQIPGRSRSLHVAPDRHRPRTSQEPLPKDPPNIALRGNYSRLGMLTPPCSVPDLPTAINSHPTPQGNAHRFPPERPTATSSLPPLQPPPRTSADNLLPPSNDFPRLRHSSLRQTHDNSQRMPAAAPHLPPTRQPTPHPNLGKTLSDGRASLAAGRSHRHLPLAASSGNCLALRPPNFNSHRVPCLEAAASIIGGSEKENRAPMNRLVKKKIAG